nr:uncharacterized protein LOC127348135 [Lolium perenne]
MLSTLNDCVRTLLFHAYMPPRFWPDALATATLLVNIRPFHPLCAGPAWSLGISVARSAPVARDTRASGAPVARSISLDRLFIGRSSPASLPVAAAPGPMLIRARAGVRRPSTHYPADQYVRTASPSAFCAGGNSVLPHDGGVPPSRCPDPEPGRTGRPGRNRFSDRCQPGWCPVASAPSPDRPPGQTGSPAGPPSQPPGQTSSPAGPPSQQAGPTGSATGPPAAGAPTSALSPCATRIGALPCRRSTMRCSVTRHGSWFPGPLAPTSSPANGS